jgi:DNA-binding response OmpR family regulator
MPDGDGVQLLEFVSANFKKIPVLLLSGFTEKSEEELLKLGARKLLLKPTDIDSLISYVKSEISV